VLILKQKISHLLYLIISVCSVGQASDGMKTTFIAKAISVILACAILAMFLVPTGFAHKAGVSDSIHTLATSCNSQPGSFPLLPFTKLKTNSNGSGAVIEVHLSSVDGNCSAMVYASHEFGYSSVPDNSGNRDEMAVALR